MGKQERIIELKAQLKARERLEENRRYWELMPEHLAEHECYQLDSMETDAKLGAEVFVFEIDKKSGEYRVFDIQYEAIPSTAPASNHEWVYTHQKLLGKGVVISDNRKIKLVAWIKLEDLS